MKDIERISEKYRKYLLEVLFNDQYYYTIFGSDLSDNETDKLLTDTRGKLLLFSTPGYLIDSIVRNNSYFDNERLHHWADEVADIEKPYASISLDILKIDNIELWNIDLLELISDSLGIIEDYSIQVNEKKLLGLLQDDNFLQFKEDLSNYFVWSESDTFETSVDLKNAAELLNAIHQLLKDRIEIRIF